MRINRLMAAALAAVAVLAAAWNTIAAAANRNDAWDWNFLGDVKEPPRLFPGTRIAKFRDTASGVICYVYTNQFVDGKNISVGGKMQDGVAGNQLGTMSCVREAK